MHRSSKKGRKRKESERDFKKKSLKIRLILRVINRTSFSGISRLA